jgi:hypothetical protein
MRSENLIRASIALFVVVIACGSEDGRPTLGAGSGTDSKGDAGASTATGFVSSPTMADATAPQGSDRCNDTTNATEGCGCPSEGATAPCWTGPANLRHVGGCKDGQATCTKAGEFLRWGACTGPVLPGAQGIDAACQSTCKGDCVVGTSRYCDEPEFCSWGKQDCLPNGKGGGSWGPCKETAIPAGCEPVVSFPGFPSFYDEDCCKQKGFCCQVGGVDSLTSEGNCTGIVTNCQ